MMRFGLLFLLALPAFGNVRLFSEWVMPTRVGHDFELRPHERTRPVVMGDLLYSANLQGKLIAIHRKGGYVLWEKKLEEGVEGSLTYGRSKIFVGDRAGNFYGIHTRDGNTAWQITKRAEWLSPGTVSGERIFVVSSAQELFALSADDGSTLCQYARSGDERMNIRGNSTPAVQGKVLYVGFSDGYLVALTTDNCQEVWKKRLRTRDRFYDILMAPLVDGNYVYVATYDGNLYKLKRDTGAEAWSFPVGSYGGFLLEDGRLYFAGLDNNFYALDSSNGHLIWKTPFEEGVGMTPVRTGDGLVFTTSADPLYVLDPKTGKILSSGGLGTGTFASAGSGAIEDGWFYTLSNYGNLSAFKLVSGNFQTVSETVLTVPSALHRGKGP